MESPERIRLFVPTFSVDDCLDEIRECLEIGWTGAGYKTEEFESAWSEYSGLSNSLFLNSNSSGLLIAMMSLKQKYQWPDDAEILTTPLTFVSTNHAIVQAGLIPVFCDVDETLCLSLNSLEKSLTKNTKAVMFVGLGGNVGQYLEIAKWCAEKELRLILDAAHMAGTKINDQQVGKEADFVVFSYQAVKNLPTGDSGLINTPDSELATIARELSWLGINTSTYQRNQDKAGYKWDYDVNELGIKANGNAIMAAIALVQLRTLDRDNDYRKQCAGYYQSKLENSGKWILVPHFQGSSRHLFQIRTTGISREKVISDLNSKNIDVGVHYKLNTHYSPFKPYRKDHPFASKVEREILSLPLHLRLDEVSLHTITESLLSIA